MNIVKVENLNIQFGAFKAVDNISFAVNKGEIFGFLGTNGAGKTTTIRVLCGLLIPTSGTAIVSGYDIHKDANAIKSVIGYMSQRSTLYNDLTVKENLDFIASLRQIKKKLYLQRRKQLLEFIEFDKSLNDLVQDLSGGMKRQVALAACLLHDPEIIFLDEPTAGVSPAIREKFWQLIRQLITRGKTIFVTTHYMDEAEQCNRIALMRDGMIDALDSPANLKIKLFPEPLYEFDPISFVSFNEISTLINSNIFDFFEPYGRRFHAVFRDKLQIEANLSRLQSKFKIIEIKPNLEDVFIKMVETKK